MNPILTVTCKEPDGPVERSIWPYSFTIANTLALYNRASEFPVLFGRPIENIEDFTRFFISQTLSDEVEPQGLIWIVDDFVGMFYMNEITDIEASVHYSFFDRRHKGRVPLVRAMVKHVFDKYKFVRLNAYVPTYVGMGTRLFIEDCGFKMEGRKRNATWWKDKWFDTHLYGILPEDLKDGRKN